MENKKDTTNNAYIQIHNKSNEFKIYKSRYTISQKNLKYTNEAFKNKSAQMSENYFSLSCWT